MGQRVGINTDSIHKSATLEISSDSFGILIPRLDSVTISQIPNPAQSLLLYQNNGNKGFRYYEDNRWKDLGNTIKYEFINPDSVDIDSVEQYIFHLSRPNNTFFHYDSLLNPKQILFWNGDDVLELGKETYEKVKVYNNYSELRSDSVSSDAEMVYIKSFSYTIDTTSYFTIGGWFYKNPGFQENGGTTLVKGTGMSYSRPVGGIDFNPDWWEVGGYDFDGKRYLNNFRNEGIQCDYDRVVSAFEVADKNANINLPNNRLYIQENRIGSPNQGQTINGNKSIIKRGSAITALSSPSPVGSNTYIVLDASRFRVGMAINGFSGTFVGSSDLNSASSYHIITAISGNTITFSIASQRPLAVGDKIMSIAIQMGYAPNVTLNDIIFDGNKSVMNATESWNFVNCIKSNSSLGLRINNCEFINMPSDCITTPGELWISNCIAKNLNACFVHGSSGTGNTYTQTGVYIDNTKADSICLSTAEANGHTSQHGFYVQSIGTRGVKITNSRITNILNGGVISPLTSQSDEFSIINSYIENASHILANISTANIYDTKIIGNTFKNCSLTKIGGGVNATGTYLNFNFQDNIIHNSLTHLEGVSYANISNNTFYLSQENGHVDFSNTELIQNAAYNAVLVVGGKNVIVNNNQFSSEYEDSMAYRAIRLNIPSGMNQLQINMSVVSNSIHNFGEGIVTGTTSNGYFLRNFVIRDNQINVRNSPTIGTGIGMNIYGAAQVLDNYINNPNLNYSIRVYGHYEDPLINFGAIVRNNFIVGSNYSQMIRIVRENNIVEGNTIEGGISYQHNMINNVAGINYKIDRVTKSITEIMGN